MKEWPNDKPSMNEARSFYLRKEFRRASQWAMGGCLAAVILVGIEWLLGYWPPHIGTDRMLVGLAGFAAGAVWLAQYLLPRVRVDDQGIRRRFLWWWRAPWPWDAFDSGQVSEYGGRHSYRIAGRPWWRGWLMQLYILDLEDTEWIRRRIERAGMTFPEPPVSRELKVKLQWPDARAIRMTPSEIIVRNRKTESRYHWSDVVRVEIWRMMSDWREFVEMTLVFDDQTLLLQRPEIIDQSPQHDRWRGAPSAVISAMVCHHIDPARIRDYALYGETRSPAERDARRAREVAKWSDYLQSNKQVLYVWWAIVAIAVLALPWMDSWAQGIAMAMMFLAMALGLQWLYWNDRKRLRQQ